MRVLVQRGECPSGGWAPGQRVRLDEDEVHHLRVRRAKGHEPVEILDGSGLRGAGRLIEAGREWQVEIVSVERQDPPAQLALAVGAADRERFFWMVEKCVELGVTRITPLETAHTAGVATRLKQNHLPKLRRAALEVLKQCGATWAPVIEEPVTLSGFLGRELNGPGWLADQSGGPVPAALDPSPLWIVVGPEGGFTQDERRAIVEGGYCPVTLGPYTLRFETAALAAVAAATQGRQRGLRS